MIINNNLNAMNAHRNMSFNTTQTGKAMEKLSSGLRINRAGDDAAGLAISEKMRGQIRGLDQATRNAQDGISLIQTAEGALNETHSILQRMRELGVQASNDTSTLTDRREIQKEINQLIEEIDRVGDNTEFNTQKLIDGSFTGKKFHIGSNQGQNIELSVSSMKTDSMGVKAGAFEASAAVADFSDLDFADATVTIGDVTVNLSSDYSNDVEGLAKALNDVFSKTSNISVTHKNNELVFRGDADFTVAYGGTDTAKLGTAPGAAVAGSDTGVTIDSLKVANVDTATTGGVLTQTGADAAITAINNAIETVSSERSKLGSFQNRLEHTINNLGTSAENLQAAESRIRDVDMASEMMNFTKNNILNQAAQAMLAQSKSQPEAVLQLLR